MAKEKDKTKGIRGKQRENHFNDGGTLKEWRGQHKVHKNRKDKRQNRRTKDKKAIQDSLDQ